MTVSQSGVLSPISTASSNGSTGTGTVSVLNFGSLSACYMARRGGGGMAGMPDLNRIT